MLVDDRTEQERAWAKLHADILETLHHFGVEDQLGKGDYLLVTDNYGWLRHTIEVHRLHMLQPAIVRQLQALLRKFPDWEIVMAVDVPGTEGLWPPMGLTIRANEIIDDLQRSYLPAEFSTFDIRGNCSESG
jgi:hypothetical protein